MKHEIKRVSKIFDELITFCLHHGANKMDMSVENCEDHFKMSFAMDNINCADERVQKLTTLLNCPRQEEIEEYCWELAGECDNDTELSLVGIMVDKAEVEFCGNSLYITLYRNK